MQGRLLYLLARSAMAKLIVVLADNIHNFRKTLRPYVEFMQDRANGFEPATLPLDHGLKPSVKL